MPPFRSHIKVVYFCYWKFSTLPWFCPPCTFCSWELFLTIPIVTNLKLRPSKLQDRNYTKTSITIRVAAATPLTTPHVWTNHRICVFWENQSFWFWETPRNFWVFKSNIICDAKIACLALNNQLLRNIGLRPVSSQIPNATALSFMP